MSDDPSNLPSEPADEAWGQIDDLVDQLARLSQSALPATDFYAELLQRVVSGLAAAGGVVWTRGPGGHLHPEYQTLPADLRLTEDADGRRHRELLQGVLETGKARLAPPRSGPADRDRPANPTDFLLILCPWVVDHVPAGVLEVFQRPGASPQTERGYLRLLQALADLVADFHRNCQLRDFRQRAAESQQFVQFTERVHGSLDLRATAYTIANESRRLAGCDRVSVLTRRGSKCRLLAVSGVDTFRRRANFVRRLECLTAAVVAVDEPLWYPAATSDQPPEIERLVHAYLDESHARVLIVLPLKAPQTEQRVPPPQATGALVVERFYGGLDDRLRGAVVAVCAHSALSLEHAKELDSVPLARALRKLRWFLQGRRPIKTGLALLATAAVLAGLFTWPADFNMEARGELQPLGTRDVFARTDGVVSEVCVGHGQHVAADQVLLRLRKPELDLEFKRVWGELQTARKKLAAVEAERLQNPRESDDQRRRYSQATAQQEELRESIRSLEEQYAILEEKQSELEVRSPLAGEVLTWNLEQLLAARPVSRGQVLMTVADLAGPWALELRVPDDRIAHVLAAQQEIGEHLEVSFVLATDPGVRLRGTIRRVGMRTEVTETEPSFVPVTVDIDRDEIAERMPGATASGRIYCGRRSIGYVWLHDLLDAVRSWWFF
jgi:multidrug efflux pump subunit AcrA (membrane-fusion protein)